MPQYWPVAFLSIGLFAPTGTLSATNNVNMIKADVTVDDLDLATT